MYSLTSETAHFFSQIYNSLKRKGKPIPINDIWIAAQALEFGCIFCTFDKHFQHIDGLLTASSVADLPSLKKGAKGLFIPLALSCLQLFFANETFILFSLPLPINLRVIVNTPS